MTSSPNRSIRELKEIMMEREDYGFGSGGSFGAGQPGGAGAIGGTDSERSRRLEDLGEKADRMPDDVAEKAQRLKNRAAAAVENAREEVSAKYDQTRDFIGRSCERMLEYGREKPGTAILIGFGAGVLAGMVFTSDRRSRGLLPAAATALAAALYDFADRV